MTKSRKSPITPNVSKQGEKTHLYSISKPRYKRPHKFLTTKQVEAIFSGCEKAYKQGMPLNRFFTIHYDDVADIKNPQAFVVDILERTRKWLKYRGLPVAYVYTIENGKDKGIHVHLLIHIPAHFQRPYKKALKKWLPFEWIARRVDVRRMQYPRYGELSPLDGMYGRLRYICKGIDPEQTIRCIKPDYQGEVFGKRWGISKSLR